MTLVSQSDQLANNTECVQGPTAVPAAAEQFTFDNQTVFGAEGILKRRKLLFSQMARLP